MTATLKPIEPINPLESSRAAPAPADLAKSPSTTCVTYGEVRIQVTVMGQGPAVVMLPSLGRDIEDFVPVARIIVAGGYRVVLPTPRGIGASRGPMAGISLADLARDVAEVIRTLAGPEAGGKALVAGHAFGNWVARMTAACHPDLVSGVALLAAAHRDYPDSLRASIDCIMDETRPQDERLTRLQSAFFAPGHDALGWLQGWHPEASRAQRAAGRITPLQAWWGAGQAPILDVQAEHDPFAPRSGAGRAVEAFGSRARVVVIADASHALLPEQPNAVAHALLDFLTQVGQLPRVQPEFNP